MANLFNGNAFIIDTASESPLSRTLAPGRTGSFRITGVRWVGATTAGQLALIRDNSGAGKTLWEEQVQIASPPAFESTIAMGVSNDIAVPVLSAGVLYIYIA